MALRERLNILVLNAGSSSQKMALFPVEAGAATVPSPLWETTREWREGEEHAGAITHALRSLWSGTKALLSGPDRIAAVGHRVVHGGREYRQTTRITPAVTAAIDRLAPLAPAHNPAALEGIDVTTRLLGADLPQFAAFDTAFHSTLPDAAALYPGPYTWWEEGIRRYGFHGISHRYCAERAAQLLGRDPNGLRLITCHLGNGCSLAAIRDGRSVDTTMGFTPLDGLMMGTRSGSIDPGLLLYRQREKGESAEYLAGILNQQSGLKGVSGISGDMREIESAMAQGNERARLAFDTFIHRLRWHIGALLPALGWLDALVFTAGIGEHSAAVRAAACANLGFLGIRLDPSRNGARSGGDGDIAAEDSPVRVLVLSTREDAAIASECAGLLDSRGQSDG
jgi:acetate kinase